MATHMITPPMQAHADELLARSARWARGFDKERGVAIVLFSSSRTDQDGSPIYHLTRADGAFCTCPSFYHRGLCCHAIACRQQTERARFKDRASSSDGEVDLAFAEVGTRLRGDDAAAAYDRVIARFLGE